jgi:glyoxylase I family protein
LSKRESVITPCCSIQVIKSSPPHIVFMNSVNLGLDHVHIYVKNLEEAISFYKFLGLAFIEYTKHGGKSCMMKTPSSSVLFEIQEVGVIENPGVNHMAFTVDDLDAICADLREKGFKIDGPLKNKNTDRYLATIRDPHGYLVQLVQK